MLFKLLQLKKKIKEARRDPSGFAGGEAVDFAIGFILIPSIMVAIGIILFFILGFTTLFGGPMLLFKILFWIALVMSFFLYLIIRPIVRFLRKNTKRVVDAGIQRLTRKEEK